MVNSVQTARVYHFGPFILDARTGELSDGGHRTPLRDQSLHLLLALLEQPGQLLTREELTARLWPAGTFVDFDRGLNKVVNHLREALGDSAEQPRFIETLPRKGYRFIAPVSIAGEDHEAAPVRPSGWRVLPLTIMLAAGIVIALAGGIAKTRTWVSKRRTTPPPISALAVIPLENLSRDPEQQYFADGLTDALITDLAKMGGVRITSRTSVMQYRGNHENDQGDRTGAERRRDRGRHGHLRRQPRARHRAIDPGVDRHAPVG